MRREKIKKNALAMAVCCVALLSCALCVSCYNDEYEGEVFDETDNDAVSVQLRVVVKNLADGTGGYEDGTGYENYIRLTGVEKQTSLGSTWTDVDYRILFYNSSDEWIGSLGSLDITEKVGSGYTVYDILGVTSYDMSSYSGDDIKVVMIANWMDYSYLITTRQSLNNLEYLWEPNTPTYPNAAKYDALVDDEGQALLPSPENGLIPFYGIHVFKNVTFEVSKRTTLDEDISLLRAMAKVEVVLENDDVTFTDVTLYGYNPQGYCAPYNVTSQDDYIHDTWEQGYVEDLHIQNRFDRSPDNEEGAENNTMKLVKTQEGSETQNETWVAYIPEYYNTKGDNFCYINVKLSSQAEDAEPYTIYFAEYTDGVTDNTNVDNRFDIHRNNLYRFYVKFNQREDNITVTVTKWNEETGSFIVLPNGDWGSSGSVTL